VPDQDAWFGLLQPATPGPAYTDGDDDIAPQPHYP